MSDITEFNKEDVYANEIKPLIDELSSLCVAHRIPLFVSVCTSNNEKESEYKHTMIAADVQGLKLKNDMFVKFLSVTLGFDTVYEKPSNDAPADYNNADFFSYEEE